MMKIYGRDHTHLRLSGKAAEYYSGATPLTIIEHEDEDEYTYTIKEPEWNVREPITERQLIGWPEDMQAEEEEENTMYTNFEITMDSFGDTCPTNWEEIAAYLNDLIEEIPDDEDKRDKVDAIWEKYCAGELDGAPAPIIED